MTALHVRATALPDESPVDWWIADGVLSAEPIAGATTVFDGGWIAPGLVDAHCHIGLGVHGGTTLEEAIEQAKKVAAASRPTGNMVSLTVAERVIGVGLARLGAEPAEVDNHLRESLALASGNGLLIETVRTELAYAEVARESGNLAAAVAHFQSAKELLTEEMGEYPRAEFLQVIEPGLQVTATAEGTAAPRS